MKSAWPLVGVRLAPEEEVTVEVVVPAAGVTALALEPPDGWEHERISGLVVGLDATFSIAEVAPRERESLAASAPLRPGRYWLVTRQGVAAAFAVDEGSESATVEVGTAKLLVHAERRSTIQVVPAAADPFTRLLSARLYVPIEAGESFEFSVSPGRYLLVGEAGAVQAEVDVSAEGAEVRLGGS